MTKVPVHRCLFIGGKMSRTVLFDNYTWNDDFTDLPKFDDFIKNNGKSHTSAPTSISKYNEMRSGKRATLHHTTVKAIERYGMCITSQAIGGFDTCMTALGVQKNASGESTHYCCEYKTSPNETIVGVYIPKTGKFKAIMVDVNGNRKNVPTIKRSGYSGEICLFLICAYSYDVNTEFRQMIDKYYNAADPLNRGDIENMFILCDNLYRRLETITSSSRFTEDRIPCDIPSSGNIPPITELNLNNGEFTPTECFTGKFSILSGGRKKPSRRIYHTLEEVKGEFDLHITLHPKEDAKVAKLNHEKYRPSPYLIEMARMAKAGMRVFMLRGEAGTGKTTDARALSYVTGLPYRRFTCSENTDETGLIVNMIPNTGKCKKLDINFPTLQDIMMDPATALASLTGKYEDGIESEEAFSQILHQVAAQAQKNAREEKDFVMVESEIIRGCQFPSIVEIQEPACISKQATLVALNSLFDGGKTITLMDGTEIERHPDSIFIFTTNSNYRGCRDFNESVLSRMEEIIDYDTPSISELTTRVMKKTGIDTSEKGNVEIMAGIVRDIQEYCRENMITGGVCCTRELENWVRSYMVNGDMKEACKFTVISKLSNDKEIRDEVTKACIETKL